MSEHRSAICLLNWTLKTLTTDSGSYESWVEGHRMFEGALECLPATVLHIDTMPAHRGLFSPQPLDGVQAVAALKRDGVSRVYVAGHYVEREVTIFALSLARLGLSTTILFDVCGTADPMAKWQALARAVDNGVMVSTVQQTLRHLTYEINDHTVQRQLHCLLSAGLGEHALELSAA